MCELACQGQDGKFFCPYAPENRFDTKGEVPCPPKIKSCIHANNAFYNLRANDQNLQRGSFGTSPEKPAELLVEGTHRAISHGTGG